MKTILRIANTLDVLCDCWNKAEAELQHDVYHHCPDIDEEAITQSFHAKLAESLRSASDTRRIESAFLKDLRASFPTSRHDHELDLQRIARGIIADVSLHRRATEKVTGGDLGVMIVRPHIRLEASLLQIADYRRGILAQAKLKRVSGWGTFTPNQKKILPGRLEYLALLLYSYEDYARRQLRKFSWQCCNELAFDELRDLLKKDTFQGNLDSCEVIKGLGNSTIGTDNDSIIDKVICSKRNSSLIIRIFWPKGAPPGSEARVYTRQETSQKTVAILRQ